jgi:hypothetical protein
MLGVTRRELALAIQSHDLSIALEPMLLQELLDQREHFAEVTGRRDTDHERAIAVPVDVIERPDSLLSRDTVHIVSEVQNAVHKGGWRRRCEPDLKRWFSHVAAQ